jgi:hypothetical protein
MTQPPFAPYTAYTRTPYPIIRGVIPVPAVSVHRAIEV